VSVRAKFISYLVVAHLLFATVALWAFHERPLLLVAAEVALALSTAVGIALVRAWVIPMQLVRTGTHLIQDGDFTARFRPTGHAEIDAMIGMYNRMIDTLRDQRLRAREQEGFVRKLIAASPSGIVTLDHDGRVSLLNAAADRLLGVPAGEVLGHGLEAVEAPLAHALTALALGSSEVITLQGRRRYKCARAEFYDRGHARTFFVVEDLTAELHATEKAAYEKLIRMITHEVNNSVAAVRSLLESLGTYAPQLHDEDRVDFTRGVGVAVTRMDHLNAFMRGFADVVRIPAPELRPCVLKALVDDILVLMAPQLRARRIETRWIEAPDTARTGLDRNQIEQVLVNVVKNAMEAIGSDGRITLALRDFGGGLTLEIADSGPGLPDSVRDRLFTPFFSTKRDGRGLGLTVVREILGQHQFEFDLVNGAEGGAVFRMRCPRAPDRSSGTPPSPQASARI
jgi:nitrogen fixation/metabolism regulation signal transduction histidine kinase